MLIEVTIDYYLTLPLMDMDDGNESALTIHGWMDNMTGTRHYYAD